MNTVGPTPEATASVPTGPAARVDLYWIPLGAGTPVVAWSGKLFEVVSARRHHRPRCDLYHAMLEVQVPDGRFMIEQAPVPDGDATARGVVASGPVGLAWAGRLRVFRYEVRCWRDGIVPDIAAAVDSPIVLSTDSARAERLLATLPGVPALVWGRDHARTGEMWNSNSVIAWVLASSGFDVERIQPPSGGRAPGWQAGSIIAGPDRGSGPAGGQGAVGPCTPRNPGHTMRTGAAMPKTAHSRPAQEARPAQEGGLR